MLLERESQLSALAEYAVDARARHGRLVLVSGEAGIGKTVLVEEFEGRLDGLRLARGACDGLFTPRPLGPLYDIAADLGGALLAACRAESPREELFALLLEQLAEEPTVVVLEDVHWADEATLDLLRFAGRRLKDLPALVIVTYRDDGLTATDPLRLVLGELATQRTTRRIDLAPLSRAAVDTLAGTVAASGPELHRLTGGNPFFVSEVIRGGLGTIPPSARDAVLARVAGLGASARRAVEAAALLGGRVDLDLLAAVSGAVDGDLDELVASGLLMSEPSGLRFRHELTRMAIAQQIPAHRSGGVHAAALTALVERGDDDARLAYHAEGAADAQAVQWFAPRAAERCAAMGAHREALAQLERALRFADGLSTKEVAELWTQLSTEAGLVDRWELSHAAIVEAVDLWRQVGDPLRIGDAIRVRGMAEYRLSRQADAGASCVEAVRTLEPLGQTAELARAMVKAAGFEEDPAASIAGTRAAEALGRELDLPDVVSDALITRSYWLWLQSLEWEPMMREALGIARASRCDAQSGRAYNNLQTLMLNENRWDEHDEVATEALAYCDEHDIATYGYCIRSAQAGAMLARGRWDEAVELAQPLVDLAASPANILMPLCTIGLANARRDRPGAMASLDQAVALADQTGTLDWLLTAHVPRAEAHLLADDLTSAQDDLAELLDLPLGNGDPLLVGELLLWSRRAGLVAPPDAHQALPPAATLALTGDFEGAADIVEATGRGYDAAWLLYDSDDPDLVREAFDRFERLGTPAASRIARQKLRQLGVDSVPAGARAATRAHPAGLTPREQEVLALVSDGLTDDQIAARLVLSVRTVHHHVSAVLAKLEVTSRQDAAAEAQRRNLIPVA